MVLDELERDAGVEQMGGDGVPEAMTGVPAIKASAVAVAGEQRLDLALPERTVSAGEQGLVQGQVHCGQVLAEQGLRRRKQRLLAPSPALQAPNDDPSTSGVQISTLKERDLSDPESVVVDQREEQPVAGISDRGEEAADFVLGEIARELARRWDKRKRGG